MAAVLGVRGGEQRAAAAVRDTGRGRAAGRGAPCRGRRHGRQCLLAAPSQLKQRSRWRHARDELGAERQRPDGGRGVQGRAAAPGDHRAADLRGCSGWPGSPCGRGCPLRRGDAPGRRGPPAAGPAEPAWRQLLRIGFGAAVDLRRDLAGPAEDGGRAAVAGHRADRGELAGLGAARGELGRDDLVVPPDAGRAPRRCGSRSGSASGCWPPPRGRCPGWPGWPASGWGLVVWVFGESFGGIFAPGLTWLFGAPGAVLHLRGGRRADRAARAGLARPGGWGGSPWPGLGLFLVGMAVLQAWPGRGFWQGTSHGQPGTLAGMAQSMAATPQPHVLSALVSAFTAFDEAHGFAVNLFAVVALAVTGAAFLTGRPRLIRPALIALHGAVPGGLGADRGHRLLRRPGHRPEQHDPVRAAGRRRVPGPGPGARPQRQSRPAAEPAGAAAGRTGSGWRDRVRPPSLRRSLAAASIRSVASAGAIGLIILGAAPMAAAQASPVADPILAQAIDGSSAPVELPGAGVQPHRPARPGRDAGQPARQGGAADLPGPGVHDATAR